jgi:hypothetical protein
VVLAILNCISEGFCIESIIVDDISELRCETGSDTAIEYSIELYFSDIALGCGVVEESYIPIWGII